MLLFAQYEAVEATSILEMALWKQTMKSGWSNDENAKRQAMDREGCRVVCGAGVVIPKVVQFLDIPMSSRAQR